MQKKCLIACSILGILIACTSHRPVSSEVHLAANAPSDQPIALSDITSAEKLYAAMAPCSRKAMSAFGAVRERYRRGLPPKQSLFVVTRLEDTEHHRETVFVVADSMKKSRVFGRIWSPIQLVRGYRLGQPISLEERDLIDWMISRPDGSEEGNLLGKFVDKMQAEKRLPTELCRP